jgi:hypothetical protein
MATRLVTSYMLPVFVNAFSVSDLNLKLAELYRYFVMKGYD